MFATYIDIPTRITLEETLAGIERVSRLNGPNRRFVDVRLDVTLHGAVDADYATPSHVDDDKDDDNSVDEDGFEETMETSMVLISIEEGVRDGLL
jgi:hypothetical protein